MRSLGPKKESIVRGLSHGRGKLYNRLSEISGSEGGEYEGGWQSYGLLCLVGW